MNRPVRVLFLCTGNSCRSQMAEALLRHLGGDRFEVFSAGSSPAGYVHDLVGAVLSRMGIADDNLRSKGWNEFAGTSFDVVITLCDSAAKEACPNWPGSPIRVHWSTPDPAFYPGAQEERLAYAMRIASRLRDRIEALTKLEWSMNPDQLRQRLAFLGEI